MKLTKCLLLSQYSCCFSSFFKMTYYQLIVIVSNANMYNTENWSVCLNWWSFLSFINSYSNHRLFLHLWIRKLESMFMKISMTWVNSICVLKFNFVFIHLIMILIMILSSTERKWWYWWSDLSHEKFLKMFIEIKMSSESEFIIVSDIIISQKWYYDWFILIFFNIHHIFFSIFFTVCNSSTMTKLHWK